MLTMIETICLTDMGKLSVCEFKSPFFGDVFSELSPQARLNEEILDIRGFGAAS